MAIDESMRVEARVVTRRAARVQLDAQGRRRVDHGRMMAHLACAEIPLSTAAVRISGEWFVRADRAESFRLNILWRESE